jgi:hypothetical protein
VLENRTTKIKSAGTPCSVVEKFTHANLGKVDPIPKINVLSTAVAFQPEMLRQIM